MRQLYWLVLHAAVAKGLKSDDDPLFVKKAEDAKAFLQQHPIPAHLIKK